MIAMLTFTLLIHAVRHGNSYSKTQNLGRGPRIYLPQIWGWGWGWGPPYLCSFGDGVPKNIYIVMGTPFI